MIRDGTKGKSSLYKIGLDRGLSIGSDLVDTFGVAGHTHKQQVKSINRLLIYLKYSFRISKWNKHLCHLIPTTF